MSERPAADPDAVLRDLLIEGAVSLADLDAPPEPLTDEARVVVEEILRQIRAVVDAPAGTAEP